MKHNTETFKVKLPRKLKKDIIKTAGRDAYWDMIGKMATLCQTFGYCKFNFKKTN